MFNGTLKLQPMKSKGFHIIDNVEESLPEIPDEPSSQPIPLRTMQQYASSGRAMLPIGGIRARMAASPFNTAIVMKCLGNGAFEERECCVYARNEKNEEDQLTNFIVRIDSIIHKHTLTGTTDFKRLRVITTNKSFSIDIEAKKYLSLKDKLKEEHPECIIFAHVKDRFALFAEYLQHVFTDSEGMQLQEIDGFDHAGWQKLPDRKMHYFSALDEECTAQRSLVPLNTLNKATVQEAVHWLFHLPTLGEAQAMWPIFLYKFTGVLAKPFEDVMNPIKFILYIRGTTNSGKTSVAQSMYSDFDADSSMVNFTGTASGIDRFIESKYDGIAVVDDLANSADPKSREILDRLLRQFCDSNGRVTAAKDKGFVRTTMRGGIVITAESTPEGARQSSSLRLLFVPIKKNTFQRELIQQLKSDAALRRIDGEYSKMDIAMSAFIGFVTQYYVEIQHQIATEATVSADIPFPRLQDTYDALQHIASIVYDFGVAHGVIAIPKDQYMSNLQRILTPLIQRNAELGMQVDPMTMFLGKLVAGVNQGLLPVAKNKLGFAQQPTAFAGYFEAEPDGLKLKLDPSRAYVWVRQQYRSSGLSFSTTPQELQRKLLEAGFSEGYLQKNHSGKTLKQVTINGHKISLLVLRWDNVLNATCNNM